MPLLQFLKNNGLNHLVLLFKRLFIVFVIYQFIRVLFFYNNVEHFSDVTLTQLLYMMWGGFRFDLTAIIYLNSLFIVLSVIPLKIRYYKGYQTFLLYVFLLTNAVGYAFNLLDIFYFDYILKRSTVELFMFANEGNMGLLILQFLKDYWLGFVLFFVLIYLTKKYYSYTTLKKVVVVNSYSYYLLGSVFFSANCLFFYHWNSWRIYAYNTTYSTK